MNPSNSTIASATLGAPIAILICWLLQTFAHVEMPAAVSAALGALTGALAGYFPQGGQAAHVAPVIGLIGPSGFPSDKKQGGRVSIGMLVHFAAIASTLALILIGPGGRSPHRGRPDLRLHPSAAVFAREPHPLNRLVAAASLNEVLQVSHGPALARAAVEAELVLLGEEFARGGDADGKHAAVKKALP